MSEAHPKVLISYSHDSHEHRQHVLELAGRLREVGVDCMIDQYILWPAEGWASWMFKQLREAEFVLVLCTPTYRQRFEQESEPGRGLGVTFEGWVITAGVYRSQMKNRRFIPIVLSQEDASSVPEVLGFPRCERCGAI